MGITTILLLIAVVLFVWAAWDSRANRPLTLIAVGLAFFAASFLIAGVSLK